MKHLHLLLIYFAFFTLPLVARANSECVDLFAVDVASSDPAYETPTSIRDLEIIFSHQERTFNQKKRKYQVFEFNESGLSDSIFENFQEESVEIIISGLGKSLFRHITLRVGSKVYSFGHVQAANNGEAFRVPSIRPDAKGVVFVVGREQIQQAQEFLEHVYGGTNIYNNPPFSSVGGRLDLVEENGQKRFLSKERVWIPGKGNADIDVYRNNNPFVGEMVEEKTASGQSKFFLVSPYGIRTRVSIDEKTGQPYVTGLSCASSAVYVLKNAFGIEVYPSVSAPNLVKKLIEGNNDFEATPDAVIFYGPERKVPAIALTPATNDRPVISVVSQIVQNAEPAQVIEPSAQIPQPKANSLWRRVVKKMKSWF